MSVLVHSLIKQRDGICSILCERKPYRDHTDTDDAAGATDHIGRGRLTKTWKCVQERGEGVIGWRGRGYV